MSNERHQNPVDDETAAPEPISEDLEVLADDVIDHVLDALGNEGGFLPLLAAENAAGERTLLTFDDEELEECLEAARGLVAAAASNGEPLSGLSGVPVRYAIAFDGAIRESEDGPYESAIIVEYGEHGMSSAYSAYMLYQHAGNPQEFVWTDPAAAGEMDLLV